MEEVAMKNPWADLIYAEDIRSKMKVPDQIILGKATGSSFRKKEEAGHMQAPKLISSSTTTPLPPLSPKPSPLPSLDEPSNEIVPASPLNASTMEMTRENYRPEVHGSPLEEIQLLRKQVAKMNHRLMAVELQNQQQSQRELLLTGCFSAFIVFKIISWLSKT
ncbi:unnamed protein product [Lepeophtheirus salmonis]|uniref:Mitochondrial fission factor n=2 Tax=Lepeophtheirus salmonis TaxID=72036 RepID=A0A7R8CF31_LEPSM|nr:uncharacterized protein LOC121126526 [Lepeophtheirus salmonis]CAB4056639.1 unnamed protein product [Lepeophtheirus salmonis]CAF2802597.1 unnamed protein product [Lepeophtheirus salmonis]